ncbi:MAG: hypothetical protein EBY81_01170, partial [Verrucomicrobia bacterium]|nr:hypothetical protein [Verrucomicrobiota bacterium]
MANDGLAVAPETARQLRAATALAEKLGLSGPEALAGYLPRRHEDRRQGWHPSDGLPMGPVHFQGVVTQSKLNRWRGRRCSVEVNLEVAGKGLSAGERVRLVYYNLPFLARAFPEGKRVAAYGRVEEKKGIFTLAHPETESIELGKEEGIHLDRVVPIYPLITGLTQRRVRSTIYYYLKSSPPVVPECFPTLEGLPTREEAWRIFHFPESLAEVEK